MPAKWILLRSTISVPEGSAGVDFVIVREIGEAFENAEQLLVPRPAPQLHIADAALRAERPKARQLVTTLQGQCCGKAIERAHEMLRLALAGLPRILANPMRTCLPSLRGTTSSNPSPPAPCGNQRERARVSAEPAARYVSVLRVSRESTSRPRNRLKQA